MGWREASATPNDESIAERLSRLSDDDLKTVMVRRDVSEWTPKAFEVAARLLAERGVRVDATAPRQMEGAHTATTDAPWPGTARPPADVLSSTTEALGDSVPWPERYSRVMGLFILLALHALFVAGSLRRVGGLEAAGLLLLGVTQVTYVIPVCLGLFAAGYSKLAKGVVLWALVTFLLNAAACATFLIGLQGLS